MDIAKIQNALRHLEPHLSVRELDYIEAAVEAYSDVELEDMRGEIVDLRAELRVAKLEASDRFAQKCLRTVAEIIASGQPVSTDYIRIACGMGTDEWRACGGPLFADLTVFCHEHNFNEWQAETMFRKEKKP